jgi:polyisoprenoid-binding protein YceI
MKLLINLLIAALFSTSAYAQHRFFTIDPYAGGITIKLNTTHEVVNGTFHLQSGSIEFDRSTSQISGTITVSAGSGNTGNGSRDKKMNKDILKSDQFAAIAFMPKTYTGTVAPTGDSTIQVAGTFTLLGMPHNLTLPMQIHIDGSTATAKGQFIVPYVQWGLKNPSFLFWKADNDVAVSLELVGQISN